MSIHRNTYTKILKTKSFSAPYVRSVIKYSQPLKQNGMPIILSLKHLAILSDISYQELYSIVHRTANYYRVFSIKKKSGGKRWIAVPSHSLMKVQKWINQNILYSIHAQRACSPHATAYVKELGHIKNAELHHDGAHIIKLDITRFFESISERQVFHVFRNLGYKPYVAFILTRVCTRILYDSLDFRKKTNSKRWSTNKNYKFNAPRQHDIDNGAEEFDAFVEVSEEFPFNHLQESNYNSASPRSIGHLPQGAPTSPMLANLVCNKLDNRLSQIASAAELVYTRYADDIIFSGEINSRLTAECLIRQISKELRSEGFKVNFHKTRYSPPGSRMIVTGICINDGDSLRVPREYKDLIRQEIYFLRKFGVNEHCQHRCIKNPLSYLMRLEGKIRYIQSIEANKGNLLMCAFKSAVPQFDSLKQFYE